MQTCTVISAACAIFIGELWTRKVGLISTLFNRERRAFRRWWVIVEWRPMLSWLHVRCIDSYRVLIH